MAKYAPLNQPDLSETENIIGRTSDEPELESFIPSEKHGRCYWLRAKRAILFHCILILGNLLFFFIYTSSYSSWTLSRARDLHSEPVRSIIEFEPKRFELSATYLANGSLSTSKPTDFNGDPRPELDEAWEKLIGHQAFRVPEEELGQFSGQQNLVQLADGSGYYVTLAVFHGLHCVKRLHHLVHRDTYYAGISEADSIRLRSHTEHCLDWLRQSIQCNSDTTLLPVYWDDAYPIPIVRDLGNHQCVKWTPLEQWAKRNSFDPYEEGLLVHPIFGYPYGEAKEGDKIGIVKRED